MPNHGSRRAVAGHAHVPAIVAQRETKGPARLSKGRIVAEFSCPQWSSFVVQRPSPDATVPRLAVVLWHSCLRLRSPLTTLHPD